LRSLSDATWLSRLQEIKSGYRNVLLGRVMRIVPAFGVGGVVNDVGRGWNRRDREEKGVGQERLNAVVDPSTCSWKLQRRRREGERLE
jgi:hypothetical protein